jgi:putative NADH-flavin reductase
MRVAIVGASGRSGREAVTHALAAGHQVTAVVRTASGAPDGTDVMVADGRDSSALRAAIAGADAVISCLGHPSAKSDDTLLTDGATALLTAMTSAGVTRLVIVSAAGAFVAGDDPLSRFVAKPLLGRFLKSVFDDTRRMEDVVRASGAEWTILRPSRLVPGQSGSTYRRRIDLAVHWHYNTRFDTVGRAAIDALAQPSWVGHSIFITG